LPSSKAKTLWIVLALLISLAAIAAGSFLYRHTRPLAGANVGAAPAIFSLLPGDAPVLAYLDAAGLKSSQSSALQAIGQLLLPAPKQDRDYVEFVRNTGFDYTRDLDRAALAIWPSAVAAGAQQADNAKTFAVAEGHFDVERIKAYALRTGHIVTSGGKAVYEVPGAPPISFQFLSPTRVALASGEDATKSLLAAQPSTPSPAVKARIDRVAAAPFFAVARTDHLPDAFYASFKNSAQLLALIRSIQGITAAAEPSGDNLAVTLDAECDSMKNALAVGTLLTGFRMIGSVALADPKERGDMTKEQAAFLTELLSDVKVSPQDNWVRLSVELTPPMLSGTPLPSAKKH
jgi:hypothetical protein